MSNAAINPNMSKKQAKKIAKAEKKAGKGKKSKVGLIIILVVVGLILAFAALTIFNVFGLRDDVVMPLVRSIPLVGNLVPDAEYYGEGYQTAEDAMASLQRQIVDLQNQLASAEDAYEAIQADYELLYNRVNEDYLELERLREIEAGQLEFVEAMEIFQRETALGNADAFMELFMTYHPELILELVLEIQANAELQMEWENWLGTWEYMTPRAVADVIELRITTHLPQIVGTLVDLEHERRAAILNILSPETRSVVLMQMHP